MTTQAKKRLLLNVSSNLANVAIASLIGIWLIPYLIGHLGVAAYGLVPLVLSVAHWFDLANNAVASSLSRYVAVHYANNVQKAREYHSTSFFVLLAISIFLVIPAAVIAFFADRIFDIPVGLENDAKGLFFLTFIATFLAIMASPFQVSPFMNHRFDLINLSKISSKILQVAVIVLCFNFFRTSVFHVGFSYFVMSCAGFLMMLIFSRCLSPDLKLSIKKFQFSVLYDILGMSSWTVLNQLGSLLYLSSGMIIINMMLGSKEVGRFAPIAQWVVLLTTLAGAISAVFTPIVYEMVGKKDTEEITRQVKRVMKYMGISMALPVGGLCIFSKPLLNIWLGQDFESLHTLMWLLILPSMVAFIITPLFSVNRGLNKVKIPAFATLLGGTVNVALSVLLVYFTDWGIYGVAVGMIVSRGLKNMLFDTVYTSKILEKSNTIFLKEIIRGLLALGVVCSVGLLILMIWSIDSLFELIIAAGLVSIFYLPICVFFLMNKKDRAFFCELIFKRKKTIGV